MVQKTLFDDDAKTGVRALTVLQPWAWAIVEGFKRIENRKWATPYRGPLYIHAGKGWSHMPICDADFRRYKRNFRLDVPKRLVFGAIIGRVDVVDCVPVEKADQSDPHAEGPFCWILDKAEKIDPYFCAGALGLWTSPL